MLKKLVKQAIIEFIKSLLFMLVFYLIFGYILYHKCRIIDFFTNPFALFIVSLEILFSAIRIKIDLKIHKDKMNSK